MIGRALLFARPLVTAAAALLSIAFVTAARADTFDWRRYQGATVNVSLSKWLFNDLLKPRIGEFEALTGIKANVDVLPEIQNRQKVTVAFTSGGKGIDVFTTQGRNEGLQYYRAGWYDEIDKYLSDPTVTPADYGFPADFVPSTLADGFVAGKRISIPIYASTIVLAYRKDLLTAAGVGVPETFEDFEEAAKRLTDKQKGQYGLCLRGIGPGAAAIVGSFFHSMGGSWTDEKGDPALLTPQVIGAAQLYSRLLQQYGPPGFLNVDWLQCQNLFAAGKIAMWLDANATMPPLLDPAKSQVAGKTGFALMPRGASGRIPGFNSPGLAIYSGSQNKGPAWYFILWATNAANNLNAQLNGVPTPRLSAWQSKQVTADEKFAELRDVTLKTMQLEKLSSYNAPFVAVPEIREIFGAAMSTAIQGGDIPQALSTAVTQIQAVRRKTEQTIQ